MPLYKLEEFHPNYREIFGSDDVKGLNVYTEGGMIVGSVADALVDQEGRFRYLVLETNVDSTTKKILLPIGLAKVNYPAQQVYIDGLSKQQVESLPEYQEDTIVDDNYEERVHSIYLSITMDVPDEQETYALPQEHTLYSLNDQYHQTFRLYEERLLANKHRVKTGEVAVGKHIETETARVSVPIQKERIVIERVPATEMGTVVDPQEVKFQEGEMARIEVYEETPDIYKEAFLREEVRVRKVLDRDTVEAQDIIRKEELDINTSGDLHLNTTGVEEHEEHEAV